MAEHRRAPRVRWASLAVAVLGSIGVACSDGLGPRPETGEGGGGGEGELERATVSGTVVSQMAALRRGSIVALPARTASVSRRFDGVRLRWGADSPADAHIFTFTPGVNTASRSSAVAPSSETRRIRHFRANDGRVHSVALIDDEAGRPPKRVYSFIDGRIQSIVVNHYKRANKGWLRDRWKATLFNAAGKPAVQQEWRLDDDRTAMAAPAFDPLHVAEAKLMAVGLAAARLVLPDELAAMSSPLTDGCFGEWAAVASTSAAVAGLTVSLGAGSADCAAGSPAGCLAVKDISARLAAAIGAWAAALDALVQCQNRMTAAPTSGGGGSGGGGSGQGIFQAIQQFIDHATSVQCDASGNDCVYYG